MCSPGHIQSVKCCEGGQTLTLKIQIRWSRLIPALAPGGKLIMTMKFFGKGRDRTECLAKCKETLGETVEDVDCLWLFANTVNERMLIATKK